MVHQPPKKLENIFVILILTEKRCVLFPFTKAFNFSNRLMLLHQFKYVGREDDEAITLAFNKKLADKRKEWLRNYVPGTYLDPTLKKIPYNEFVNKELILFSLADCVRSIPSIVDGWKPGQRKVLILFA